MSSVRSAFGLRLAAWYAGVFVISAADTAHPTQLLLMLGAVFSVLTFVVKGPVGYCAGALSAGLRARPRVLVGMHRSSGAVLVALGVRLAFERRP